MGATLNQAKAATTGANNEVGAQNQRARGIYRSTQPGRQEILNQLTEALRTGGVHAQIPMIQQAISAANQANARGLTQTAEGLASRNIGGPFAASLLAQQRQAGESQVAQMGPQMAQQLVGQFMPFLNNTQSMAFGGLSQMAQMAQQAQQFNAAQKNQQAQHGGLLGGGILGIV